MRTWSASPEGRREDERFRDVRLTMLPEKIVLVGMMGAGKTSVGRVLADRVGYAFVDLDEEIERHAGHSVASIFSERGEDEFRVLEAAATKRLDDATGTVLAVGGGWMARSELRDRWPDAVRVWLRISLDEAWRRVSRNVEARPMLDPERPRAALGELMDEREPFYELAEASVECSASSPEEVADLVLRLIGMLERNGRLRKEETGS